MIYEIVKISKADEFLSVNAFKTEVEKEPGNVQCGVI